MSLFQTEPLDGSTRPTLAGDWQDDDGQVLDDLVQPQANPLPVPPQEMVTPATERPKRPGRIISGTLWVDPTWGPTQILPADANRKNLIIQNGSTEAADAIRVADDSGKCQVGSAAGLVFPANPLTLPDYTGPIYVSAADAAEAVPLSWWAVTE